MYRYFILLFLVIAGQQCLAHHPQTASLRVLHEGTPTSIRGLSVVDDQVAWVSGSQGWVGRTADRGQSWSWSQVPGFEDIDFRDIEAFSDQEAVLLSAGSPLLILRTVDGGVSWSVGHRDDRAEIFFDGMDFWDDGHRGIAFGDAIDGRMPLLVTSDRGRSWQDITGTADLRLAEGEAGFAASGTCIRVVERRIYIGTGGSRSRILFSDDGGFHWDSYPCPIVQGSGSTGIFSIAFRDRLYGIAVGGDYLDDQNPDRAVIFTRDGGRNWHAPVAGTGGYRSAVEYLFSDSFVACGTSGVDLTTDGGQHWQRLTSESYHAVRRAKNGDWVLLAGANGRIAELPPGLALPGATPSAATLSTEPGTATASL